MLGKIEGRRRRGRQRMRWLDTSPTQWTWVWVNSGSWWWTGRPGVLQFMGSQRVGHDWATELNWTSLYPFPPFKIRRLEWGTDVCGYVHPQTASDGGIDWSIVWTCAPSKSLILLTWNWPTTTGKKNELCSAAPVRAQILRVLVVSSKERDLHKVSQTENGWMCAREDGERLCGHFNFGF